MQLQNTECHYCNKNIVNDVNTITLSCNHVFHDMCWKYSNNICPHCVKNTETKDEYVWIYGSFIQHEKSQNMRKNTVLLDTKRNDNYKLSSGYFWREYNKENSNTLETQYKISSTKLATNINIENSTYTIFDAKNYDFSYDIQSSFAININCDYYLQYYCYKKTNSDAVKYCKPRPVLRIKLSDAIQHLLYIGNTKETFYDKYYIYTNKQTRQSCFFDTEKQIVIKNICENTKTYLPVCKFLINEQKYQFDANKNEMINVDTNEIYIVSIYKNENITNY